MSNQFTWTDEAVKQFARVYAAGRTGKYKKARKIEDKMSIFKQTGWSEVSSKTRKRGRPSTTLLVDKWEFLSWYFNEEGMKEFAELHEVPHKLFIKNRFWIRIEDLIDWCGALPVDVVHESMRADVKTDEDGDVDLSYYTTYKFVMP